MRDFNKKVFLLSITSVGAIPSYDPQFVKNSPKRNSLRQKIHPSPSSRLRRKKNAGQGAFTFVQMFTVDCLKLQFST